MKSQTKTGPAKMDMLDLMMWTALDCLYLTTPHPFHSSPTIFSLQIERQSLPFILSIGTPKFHRKLVDLVPNKQLHHFHDIVNEMYIMNLNVFEVNKRALESGDEKVLQQICQGHDIVSVLHVCFTCAIHVII